MEKQLNPELVPIFSVLPEWNMDDIGAQRSALAEMQRQLKTPTDPNVTIEERYIPGTKGAPEIRIRIYKPKEKREHLPGLLYFHGGGFILGSIEISKRAVQSQIEALKRAFQQKI